MWTRGIRGLAGGPAFEKVLNFRVAAPSRFFEGAEGLIFLFWICNLVDGVNPDQSALQVGVEGKTTPRPVLRMIDQFSFQRIHVHVVKLFDSLLQTPHIEIVEAPLPRARRRIVAVCKVQIQLSGDRPPLATQAARPQRALGAI